MDSIYSSIGQTITFALVIMLAFTTPASAQHAPRVDELNLEQVDLFLDGVSCTWKALSMSNTSDIVVARSFSRNASIQVSWQSKGSAPQIVSATPRAINWYSAGDQAQYDRLNTAIHKLDLAHAKEQVQRKLVAEDLMLLQANRSIGGTNESLLTEDLDDMLLWYHNQVGTLLFRGMELDEELAQTLKTRQDLVNQQAEFASRPAWEWHVEVPISGRPAGQPIEWTARVQSGDSNWQPLARVNLEGDLLILERMGDLTLRIPYSAVTAVVLHEASTRTDYAKSSASTWRIASYKVTDRRSKSAPQVAYSQTEKGRGAHSDEQVIQEVEHMSAGEHTRANYVLSEPISPDQRITLNRQLSSDQADFSPVRVSVPREGGGVQVRLGISRSAWGNVGSSPLSCTVNGQFHGLARPDFVGDTVYLMVGQDKAWAADRLLVEMLSGNKTLGVRTERHVAYRLTVRNNSNQAGEVLLEESVPMPSSSDVNVEVVSLDGGARDAETGVVSWRFELEPGAHKTVQIAYNVSYPRSHHVPGF